MSVFDFRFRIYESFLTYPGGQEVHTAASGRIAALHEYLLEIEDQSAGVSGWGEIRANIAFITGTPEAKVLPGILTLLQAMFSARSSTELEDAFAAHRVSVPKICQALVDNALVDLFAKRAGRTLAEELSGAWKAAVPCNECVFWGSDKDMARNVASYVSLGFTKIKVRVGIGTIEDDERRLAWLRDNYRDAIQLSADANGAWAAEDALRHIDRLARFDLNYIEQPTRKGDWPALEQVAKLSPLPVMIDEGLQDEGDIERVCANQGRITAHLKICKAGGVRNLVAMARKFDAADVGYVVGQMNEGAVATAVAVQAAMVVSPIVGELYGALGIENDPGSGVAYSNGCVGLPKLPGLGIGVERALMSLLWDSHSAA